MSPPIKSNDEQLRAGLSVELEAQEAKAWEALGRYKFFMFGYHAAQWVNLNRIGRFGLPNPWTFLVLYARQQRSP